MNFSHKTLKKLHEKWGSKQRVLRNVKQKIELPVLKYKKTIQNYDDKLNKKVPLYLEGI